MAELAKTYDPRETEARWYEWWVERGYFEADSRDPRRPCCVTIPPPNVTGTLHMGHALQHSIHDALARWARMQGHSVCVVPGIDHAGIGTQIKVTEHLLATTGKSPQEIGREAWLEAATLWAAENGGGILRQLRALGCSYDWRRERYTLDDGYYHAVMTAFRRFYEKGWIYRGERMVNWCVAMQTVVSDLEIENREVTGGLWRIRYPGLDGAPDIVVSTTRPETMLGDTAVAVHPDDERYRAAIGGHVMLPLMERPIPIVGDAHVDPEFGTGGLKVTPAHDVNDWEIGQRHGLPAPKVIGLDGRITEAGGRYAGLTREEARDAVLADLEAAGLLLGKSEITHTVPHHDRTGDVIEPLPMEQWFCAMREMAQAVLPWYREGAIQFVPDRFREYGVEWLENIRDWCISRQLWWGHRIPIYYGESSGRAVFALSDDEARASFGAEPFRQEEDVLDTWFSSALWPFAVLGWPDPERFAYVGGGAVDAGSLTAFHPTRWMITARDILYLWVVRMAMTAQEFVGQIPFETVVVHPTIQTKDGQRMSRSLGTGVDPLELIAEYGADATRLMLLMQCGGTQDMRFDAEVRDNKLERSATGEMCRNFMNKIWNAARFVLMNLGDELPGPVPAGLERLEDRWILTRLNAVIATVTGALEAYRFDEATNKLYAFIWSEFCDWYIEAVKPRLRSGDATARAVLRHVLEATMRLLHPFAPFISEAIWQQLGGEGEACAIAAWPAAEAARNDCAAEEAFGLLQEVVREIRNLRAQAGLTGREAIEPMLRLPEREANLLAPLHEVLESLVGAKAISVIGPDDASPEQALPAVVGAIDIYLPLAGLIDLDAERARLTRERDKAAADLAAQRGKLANANFVERAPAAVVDQARAREAELAEMVERLGERLNALRS